MRSGSCGHEMSPFGKAMAGGAAISDSLSPLSSHLPAPAGSIRLGV